VYQQTNRTVPRFSLTNIRIYRTPPLVAMFDLRLAGVVLCDCKLLRPQVGNREMVVGPSSRDRFEPTGWRSHANLDPDLAAEILCDLKKQLGGIQEPTRNDVAP
jgi:hypothetical protein